MCVHELEEHFEIDLEEIKLLLTEYKDSKSLKVRRFGLPFFCKEFLNQYFEYLSGYFTLQIQKKPFVALQMLQKSVSTPQKLYHSIGRNMLALIVNTLTLKY